MMATITCGMCRVSRVRGRGKGKGGALGGLLRMDAYAIRNPSKSITHQRRVEQEVAREQVQFVARRRRPPVPARGVGLLRARAAAAALGCWGRGGEALCDARVRV